MMLCFQASRSFGLPAVGAYPTSSALVKSGTNLWIALRIAGFPSIIVVPIVPLAVLPNSFASLLCAIMPLGK